MQRRCYRRLDCYIADNDVAVCNVTTDAHIAITARGYGGSSFISHITSPGSGRR